MILFKAATVSKDDRFQSTSGDGHLIKARLSLTRLFCQFHAARVPAGEKLNARAVTTSNTTQ